LSKGRVDLGFARGWNPNDFVLAPQNYAGRTEGLFSGVRAVQRLWRGETIRLPNGVGQETEVRVHPLPCQRDLSVWVTCTEGAERFEEAGAFGASVLTALLFQSVPELTEKIALYREARRKAGHDPAAGRVTLMLHTFVGEDDASVREKVRGPFIEYLRSSVDLWRHAARRIEEMTAQEREQALSYAFERYYRTSALFGAPETCLPTVQRLRGIGVDEIACLIDFGVETEEVLKALNALDRLREMSGAGLKKGDESPVSRHYDALAAARALSHEHYLTFGVFERPVPGFSWVSTFCQPDERPQHARLARQAQMRLREVLFGEVDLSAVRRALDIGCGYASDLIALAQQYPCLRLDGCTLSPEQARIGRGRVEALRLQDRVRVRHQDSAREDLPARYDLIFGLEVAVYVEDKPALFANISRHLNDGGALLLADFVANGLSPIRHPETSSHIVPRGEWVRLLSENGLRVLRCIGVSREVGRFLDDPDFEQNLSRVAGLLPDESVRTHLRAWHNLGKLLRTGAVGYVLLAARRDAGASPEALAEANRNALASPAPYPCRRPAAATRSPAPDLKAEAVLDETIRPAPGPSPDRFERVFLTGATGFLGAFLLHDLLRQTGATVHALVRAPDEAGGLARIQRNLTAYGLYDEAFRARIVPVVGDLSRPLLSLDTKRFEALAEEADAVYHVGALLHFVWPYETLRPANVLGTQEALRLACRRRAKPFHHVSTTAVFDAPAYAGQTVTERTHPNLPDGMRIGYAQTKWVAERLARIAGERGLPVCVYRPAWMSGHSRTGVCDPGDFLCRVILACASLAILRLSQRPQARGRVFHLINPRPVSWEALREAIQRRGYPVERIPYDAYQARLRGLDRGDPLYPLLPLFLDAGPEGAAIPRLYRQGRTPRLDNSETLAALTEVGVPPPPDGETLLDAVLSRLARIGLLEAPP
jgi:natural product biosynthesis luciferase-like monooxygenase protein